ncbi:capsule biosynthesis protein [Cupriavidus sp. SS-3]|uniref:capsule biosynthesis protein n=1 Tax=Cupriavidus sp. SS-3 TaxID=3109596 RepID=UPI002DB780C0|nr:capsular biosynthesis protein [Cupriavidus sp. SS-3]MEC3766362.1 capsular biosynthesis protein [Cupriavidus sp. SS-3]
MLMFREGGRDRGNHVTSSGHTMTGTFERASLEGSKGTERAGLHQLVRYQHVLLLQGPNGPFFARLRDYLESAGRRVSKVNFNGGDDYFYRRGTIERFTQPMPAWQPFLRKLLVERCVDAIVVFGSSRRHHRIAARLAKAMGIAFWVFEEGYVRPDYITLEADGVNADSPIAAWDMKTLPAAPRPAHKRHFKRAFGKMAWYSFLYFSGGISRSRTYPHYRHHKPFGLHEIALWLRAGYRKHRYRAEEREIKARLLAENHPPFFLVALQVYNDSQIRVHSPWRRIEDFIEWTVYSFAHHAPADCLLVIKHHPMDRGHTNYARVIADCAARFGSADRVLYIHDAHLPSLLHRCSGLVTVNSTTGLQALYHRVPVIALGRCFYAKTGITYQGALDQFWWDSPPVDTRAFTRFRNFLIHCSQINSSFYADSSFVDAPTKGFGLKGLYVRIMSACGLVAVDVSGFDHVDLSPVMRWASGLVLALVG